MISEQREEQARLYGSPLPIKGESFTSWLLRLAAQHQVSVSDVAGLLLRKGGFSDLDIGKHVRTFERIAHVCMLPLESLAPFRTFGLGFLGDEDMAWVTSALPSGRSIRRFCPECLAEELAYYRASWRLCSTVVCPDHALVLADCCGECQMPVSVPKFWNRIQIMPSRSAARFCPACKSDLSMTDAVAVPTMEAARIGYLQRQYEHVVESGIFRHQRLGKVSGANVYLAAATETEEGLVFDLRKGLWIPTEEEGSAAWITAIRKLSGCC